MSSNRPFLANFLTAFRAHGSLVPKAGPSLSSSTVSTTGWSAAAAAATTTYTGPTQQAQQLGTLSSPRAIDPRKAGPGVTQASSTTFSPQHGVTPLGSRPRSTSPGAEHAAAVAQENKWTTATSSSTTAAVGIPSATSSSANRRRGSDSSSEGGFRDVAATRGGEKWYIGGRTAGGEERYYKLSMVRRERSADRLSTDRLSL